eukprot:TRINITY_DN412_c2_g1_i2.p1 TRINITY_DN412_c2_g1~~TRINITY_DN412_c2_g1_i2.p1  ORF type:complete len:478 (+),score=224.35 TRINITY_DN412_c2_g1_i2:1174-2607(+)
MNSVFDLLVTLPNAVLTDIYDDPWTCQAIFRSLSPLAKQYVLRLLFVSPPHSQGGGVTTQTLSGWGKPGDNAQHTAAVRRLKQLLLISWRQQGGQTYVCLAPKFQHRLQALLRDDSQQDEAAVDGGQQVPLQQLDQHARRSWHALLLFILGNPEADISEPMLELILSAQLMSVEEDGSARITNQGFQFALRDTPSQLWTLLLCYLNSSLDARQMNKREVLSLLFRLSFMRLGAAYPTSGLSASQRLLLRDLHALGVVYLPPTEEQQQHRAGTVRGEAELPGQFYVTRLLPATPQPAQPAAAAASLPQQQHEQLLQQGFIIVESSYRLYAYTSSELHIALLGLFVRLTYRLPNVVVGVITRDSIRAAIKTGISADQIIEFLNHNTHPHANRRFPRVPETVTDQIRLWEAERNRVAYQTGTLFDSFSSIEAFNTVERYARDCGTYLWSKVDTAQPSKSMLFVSPAGHEPVRQFIKKNLS